ncbi:DUF2321 domain-containing protein [Candidatus Nitrosocosmicus agrestis]|uniref:DUF2321 domain-containing protein n=1 Tax=Candidatus Nitrosocosmicus agrestis TaxID=2563600 RepID=UPI00122E65E5|nr:DUF2321 domain-containing protein [Candidatus Nitrosocosmicus sp. SS]KAA2282170.1 DUF2321 domain-containing protein [Candidatus Nitrosocosmicus sp. SS]KAF0869984.1 DUF2321 domain-containing protein [Candidatus Nitrosocosmicus sp. SS]
MIRIGENTYYHAIICLNGHIISDSIESFETKMGFCKDCGKPTINKCQNCKNPIHGDMYIPNFVNAIQMESPSFCYGCGNPYPWTKSKINALEELIDFEEKLSETNKEDLKKNINDIINETPRTKIATIKFKHLLTKMGKETGIMAKNLAVEMASETAKKYFLEK